MLTNGTIRRECLNLEWFETLPRLNEKIQEWWHTYNTIRPHSSIGYKTPDGEYIVNPDPSLKLQQGSKLIVIGRPNQIESLKQQYEV